MRRLGPLGPLAIAGLATVGCGGSSSSPPPAVAPLWSDPITLPAPAPPPSADVAERPDGSAIAVWSAHPGGGTNRLLAAERNAAGVWSAGAPVMPDSPTPIQSPAVAVDPSGAATVAWALWDRPGGAVYAFVQAARQRADGSWGSPVTLSHGTNGIGAVLVAAPASGRVVVAWSGSARRDGSYFAEVKSAVRSPAGAWTLARVAGLRFGDPMLGSDALGARAGRVRLIWASSTRHGFPGGIIAASLGPDGRWAPPQRLAGTGVQQTNLTVATGPDGTMTAVWRRQRDGRLWLTRSRSGGWSASRQLAGGAAQPDPLVLAGPGGRALVVLERERQRQRQRNTRSVLQVVRVGADGSTSSPVTLVARPVPPARGALADTPIPWEAAAAITPTGTAAVAWPSARRSHDGFAISSAIVARISTGPRGVWSAPERVVRLDPPVAGVFPSLDSLPDSRVEARWSSQTPESAPTRASVRRR